MTIKIASFTNPKIKDIVKLRDHRTRVKTGLTLIDGVREVSGAMAANVSLQEVFVCPELLKTSTAQELSKSISKLKVPVYEVTPEIFKKICFGDRAEGILAVGEPQTKKISELNLPKNPILMMTERVEKPGNLGAILRTCDAAGINALFVSDPATDIFNPNVIRASVGTVFAVPVVTASAEEIFNFFRQGHVRIVATTPSAKKIFTVADFRPATAIVIGSEKEGLSDFWLKNSDEKIFIPMQGKADSLNTSVAAALVAYEALRQRSGG